MQHPLVHSGWPGAMSNRVRRLSDRPEAGLQRLIDNYRNANAAQFTLQCLERTGKNEADESKALQPRTLWMQCPYHPLTDSALKSALRLVQPPRDFPKLRVSYSNQLPSLGRNVISHNRSLWRSTGDWQGGSSSSSLLQLDAVSRIQNT